MGAIPFNLGDVWQRRDNPNIQGRIVRTLMSRPRLAFEAWCATFERYPSLQYPFPADDEGGRGRDILIDVETWERVR